MSKRVKAGIVDVDTAIKRLVAGEIFYYYGGKLQYDVEFALKGLSPFRYESVAMLSSWWYVELWRIEVPTTEEQAKPVEYKACGSSK